MTSLKQRATIALEHNNKNRAIAYLADAIRQNPNDIEAWLMLESLLDQPKQRTSCLRQVLTRQPDYSQAWQRIAELIRSLANEDMFVLIEHTVAGIAYNDRYKLVAKMLIGEPTWLIRDPANAYDEHAIRVERSNRDHLGFINRNFASYFADYLDDYKYPYPAIVTELVSGFRPGSHYRVGISFVIPANYEDGLSAVRQRPEYHFDQNDYYAYILLNCSKDFLEEVKPALTRKGLVCEQAGPSQRPASNGRLYNWYIRVKDSATGQNPNSERIENFFEDVFGMHSLPKQVEALEVEKYEQEQAIQNLRQKLKNAEEAYQEDQDVFESASDELQDREAEINQLKGDLNTIRAQLQHTQYELDEKKRLLPTDDQSPSNDSSLPTELSKILESLMPEAEFLRDSLDTLVFDFESYLPALRKLHDIYFKPEMVKAAAFKNSPGFKELKFSGNGRLYYKDHRGTDGRLYVLISQKKYQRPKDETFLSQLRF